jgi:hypothetical protein
LFEVKKQAGIRSLTMHKDEIIHRQNMRMVDESTKEGEPTARDKLALLLMGIDPISNEKDGSHQLKVMQ